MFISLIFKQRVILGIKSMIDSGHFQSPSLLMLVVTYVSTSDWILL